MKTKLLILGGGGIIGQHMLILNNDVYDIYITRTVPKKDWWISFNDKVDNIQDLLESINPNFIINLSGENRVDVVEENPNQYLNINVKIPEIISNWCQKKSTHFIQCSTQGVFSGNNPTYKPLDTPHPITEYGKQKLLAEQAAMSIENSEIVRLTFVLGIRPFSDIGRRNPLEDMLEKSHQLQVDDRFFSPLFAHDAAKFLLNRIGEKDFSEKIYHLGNPIRCSRFSIASKLKEISNGILDYTIDPVSHSFFPGLAERPYDTTWTEKQCYYSVSLEDGLNEYFLQWRNK